MIKDMPFSLDSLLDLTRYVREEHFQTMSSPLAGKYRRISIILLDSSFLRSSGHAHNVPARCAEGVKKEGTRSETGSN